MSKTQMVRQSVVMEGLENRSLLSGSPILPPTLTLHERAGLPFTAELGSFSAPMPVASSAAVPVNDVATIAWGDGTTSMGRLVYAVAGTGVADIQVEILGTHTYAAQGVYTINVNVFGNGALDPFLHITDAADVAPAVGVGGVTINEQAHQAFTAIVGSFTAVVPATGLSASIDWGDGTTSPGKLIPNSVTGVDTITMDVQGQHDYPTAGTYDITVTVIKSSIGLSPVNTPVQLIATIDSQAIVSPSVGVGGVTIIEDAGKQFTANVGAFAATAPATGFSAVINWGDGTSSIGKLIPGAATAVDALIIDVQGTHDYVKGGIYDITINIFKAPVSTTTAAPTSYLTIDSEAIVISPVASLVSVVSQTISDNGFSDGGSVGLVSE